MASLDYGMETNRKSISAQSDVRLPRPGADLCRCLLLPTGERCGFAGCRAPSGCGSTSGGRCCCADASVEGKNGGA